MTLRRRHFYDVTCDHPQCGICTGDLDEYAAWSEAPVARDSWTEAGMQELDYTVCLPLRQSPVELAACQPVETWELVLLIHLCDEHRVTVADDLAEEL